MKKIALIFIAIANIFRTGEADPKKIGLAAAKALYNEIKIKFSESDGKIVSFTMMRTAAALGAKVTVTEEGRDRIGKLNGSIQETMETEADFQKKAAEKIADLQKEIAEREAEAKQSAEEAAADVATMNAEIDFTADVMEFFS